MALFARTKQATVYRSYLRGRLRAAGVLSDGEAKQYADPELPTPLLVGYVLGAIAGAETPLPSEAEIDAEVGIRLAPVPPPPPALGAAEQTERIKSAPWIGDPLPSAGR